MWPEHWRSERYDEKTINNCDAHPQLVIGDRDGPKEISAAPNQDTG
jgi:hypothetical protein